MPFLAVVWCRDADAVRNIRGLMTTAKESGYDPGELVAVHTFPNRAELTCRGFCANNKRMSPWTRHIFGYMICGVCGGRHKDTRRRIVRSLFDALGANLLKSAPALFRTPDGYGRSPRD
jgi:hypothetical protein